MTNADSEPRESSVSDGRDASVEETAEEDSAEEEATVSAVAHDGAATESADGAETEPAGGAETESAGGAETDSTEEEAIVFQVDDDSTESDSYTLTLEDLIGADLTRLVAERDEYLDSLRRLQADFDNYRKRAMRQQTELLERASENVLVQLLPVLDVIDLAEAHSNSEGDANLEALSQIGALLRDTLKREGLERIDDVGVAFDPTVHDAVAHEEADDETARGPQIAEVMRAGYLFKGRVVRPAMVKVKG
ncbi:MAG: nucleotide exchange factor GrpE [Acidimicrobiales bacterium]|jgi:molecular chaperone GrpE